MKATFETKVEGSRVAVTTVDVDAGPEDPIVRQTNQVPGVALGIEVPFRRQQAFLVLSKSEARAVASALMGAAAELTS